MNRLSGFSKVYLPILVFLMISCKDETDDDGGPDLNIKSPVMEVQDVFLEDVGNSGSGSDLKVLFTEPEDVSNIKEYRIVVFTYQQYVEKPFSWVDPQYFVQINPEAALSDREIVLNADLKDIIGESVHNDQQYRIVISSVPKNTETNKPSFSLSRVILLIDTDLHREGCGDYSDWSSSPYVLPYPPGKAYRVLQGNCSPWPPGHHISKGGGIGYSRYAYDISMPLGEDIVAMRGGKVVWTVDGNKDFDPLPGNSVWIDHGDGTFGFYAHLGEGLLVSEGETVEQGQLIAKSGGSGGLIEGWQHIHIAIHGCLNTVQCPSSPMTFNNTLPNENGLEFGVIYPAMD